LDSLDYYLVKKAPFQLPDNLKEWLVQYGPWITHRHPCADACPLPPGLCWGLGAVLIPFAGPGLWQAGFGFFAIGVLVHTALTVMALPGLFARKMSGAGPLLFLRTAGEHRRQPPWWGPSWSARGGRV